MRPDADELEYLRRWQRWARLVMQCEPGGCSPGRVRSGIADTDDVRFMIANPEPMAPRRGPRRKGPAQVVAELLLRKGGG